MKALCKCGDYKPYSSTLKGINAPSMPLDACVSCLKGRDEFDKAKFIAAMNKVKSLNKEN